MTNGVLVDEVSFDVRIPSGGLLGGLLGGLGSGGGGETDWIVRGSLYRPPNAPRCTNSVLLLLHGVSQGRHAWDLRAGALHYSAAHRLAPAGYPVVAVDRLGYGTSDRPSGRDLTIAAHASVTAKGVEQAAFVLACAINRFRNEEGTGHGRPHPCLSNETHSRIAAEGSALVSELLLEALR